ncbi:hypothetical protein ISTM_205 [Insectomime virus]|uniref:Uncharacterized protein n=2 Tax=root TaxID=1 RepID=V9SD65_9VIRU|nr:hypothetical protein D1R32_gp111 [Tunisvirus fontaine2]AHA46103.1 hypothetical protein ISTM_205 [Insectomime virus]AHC54828.1 hypothetical protein TNS_ORF110 [Tunisvirus fontaine2]
MNKKLLRLAFQLDSEDDEQKKKAEVGISSLAKSPILQNSVRLSSLETLFKTKRGDIGSDCLCASRDSLNFLADKRAKKEVDFLVLSAMSENIDSFQRLLNAVCLYNFGHFNICYELFSTLSKSQAMFLPHRLEALKFLVFSEEEENTETARSIIVQIAKDLEISSVARYKFVAEFSHPGCMKSLCNIERLWTTPPAEFMRDIQNSFFSVKENNGVRENILCAQCLLQLQVTPEEEKAQVMEWLCSVAENFALGDMDVQADACDVLLRLGSATYRARANTVLTLLAQEKRGMTTVYTDKQNVHTKSVNESVNEFLEKCIEEEPLDSSDFSSVHADVVRLANEKLSEEEKKKALAALERISIDTATFTDYELCLSDVFVIIWRRIQKKEASTRSQMLQRLLEELVDMAGTCSSGHCSRLVNSLSYFEANIRIGFREQIRANFSARMNSRIRKLEDVELQSNIICGMGDDENSQDRKTYLEFVAGNYPEIRDELYKEFVDGGYVTSEQFCEWSVFLNNEW